MVDALRDLLELVVKLVLLDLQAASVCLRNRNRRLEVRLLVDAFHHRARVEEEVRALQFRLSARGRNVDRSCMRAIVLCLLGGRSRACCSY